MKKLKSSLLNMAVVLTVISIIAGGALAYINEVTAEPIRAINEKNLNDGIKKVVLGTADGELTVQKVDTVGDVVIYATDKGAAVQATTGGFGGELKVLVGFDAEGAVKGYTILAHSETPGLGAKAETWFQKGAKGDIIGKNPSTCNLTVSKDGGDVDAITASTITSRAFLKAVQSAYNAYVKQSTDGETGASTRK